MALKQEHATVGVMHTLHSFLWRNSSGIMHVLNHARSSGTHALHKMRLFCALSVGGRWVSYSEVFLEEANFSLCLGLGLGDFTCKMGQAGLSRSIRFC